MPVELLRMLRVLCDEHGILRISEIRAEALKNGLILLRCGVYAIVVRFLAPLTLQEDVFEEAMDILQASITAVKGRMS